MKKAPTKFIIHYIEVDAFEGGFKPGGYKTICNLKGEGAIFTSNIRSMVTCKECIKILSNPFK